MPIKQTTCSICNALVNKAVTYHVGDGKRACKTHEGVTTKRDELEQSRSQKLHEELIKAKRRFEKTKYYEDPSLKLQRALTPRCWLCMNEGLRQDDFFMRLIIEREKAAKLYGAFSPFDANHPGNKINIGRCIFILSKDMCSNIMSFIREDFVAVVQMANAVAVCGPCCGTFKINPLPEVKSDDLVKSVMLYDMIKPTIQKIADTELAKGI